MQKYFNNLQLPSQTTLDAMRLQIFKRNKDIETISFSGDQQEDSNVLQSTLKISIITLQNDVHKARGGVRKIMSMTFAI